MTSPPDPSTSTLSYLQHLQGRVHPLTQAAAQIPNPSDLSFHRSLDKQLTKDLNETKNELVSTIQSLLSCIDTAYAGPQEDGMKVNIDDLVDANAFERNLGDTIDTLLERTDMRLDEYQGKIPIQQNSKRASSSLRNGKAQDSTSANPDSTIPVLGPLPSHILNAPIKPLPQTKFSVKPDNSRSTIWKHSLTQKPHAQVPLTWRAPSLEGEEEAARSAGIRQGMYCAEGDPRFNPYYLEINSFAPPSHALQVPTLENLVAPPPLIKDEPEAGPIPFIWVNDQKSFDYLYDHLMEERVKEIAVDVEHHQYRSYQGLVCLVQISTRWKDFIIDALSPVIRQISTKLNDAFADPAKVKILHGAEHDVLWLQRDLGLYLVGLFDTYHATNVLQFPQHGLAYLLSRYIDFVADKRYQRADWRIRPLPKEMMYYARSDTHTLVHIYDCLRFEIEKQQGSVGIRTVFELSKRTAQKTYAKEQWNDSNDSREGWRNSWRQLGGIEALDTDARWDREGITGLTQTERLFRALHNWRDEVARLEDESPKFILGSHNLLNLASRAPQKSESVLAIVGQSFKRRVPDLLNLISAEIIAFERAQADKAAKQKELLESAASGNALDDEEMGEVVHRDADVGRLKEMLLWPTNETRNTLSAPTPSSSSLASMLFKTNANQNESGVGAAATKMAKSLFAPASTVAASQQLLQGIRSDLTSALGSLLTGDQSATMSNDDTEVRGKKIAEAVAEPPKVQQDTESENKKTDAVAEQDVSDTVMDDGVLRNVRKTKGKKSSGKASSSNNARNADDVPSDDTPAQSVPSSEGEEKKQKKRKWTKEEKAQRKRQQEDALSNVEPFDYTTANSVLDAKSATPTNTSRQQKPSKKKGEGKSANNSPANNKGRYANVPVGRDRREQAGGKSMTFSR
ncbi:uncharacterized protein FA14DRAFT_161765 [Meira miltonrushii]|uniref:HRDC domain-containing protein n=1 Tax=Meira miltonrushii TaxID=1280837 RepID=A0A316VB64_9BASI|nr:uncharacterized protein FA14DRAFT_161765 [Meira miltonrushii]PWN34338.1 hypothetical protein FA14DRAFT_161765 [Meira miltonrushii]